MLRDGDHARERLADEIVIIGKRVVLQRVEGVIHFIEARAQSRLRLLRVGLLCKLLGQTVLHIGLAQHCIALVFFVREDRADRRLAPCLLPAGRGERAAPPDMKEKIDIVRDNGIDPRYAYKYYLEKHDYDLIPHEKESSQPALIESEVDHELLSLFSRLTKDQQQQVLDYLRFLLSKS